MKFAIIESYLKGLEKLPQTVEGFTKKVNDLTAEMRLPPLSGDEMEHLAVSIWGQRTGELPQANGSEKTPEGKTANRATRRTKNKSDGQ